MWPFDIIRKLREQKQKKRKIVIWLSLISSVVVLGTAATTLGILLTKSSNITRFTKLKVGVNLSNKYLLMPQIGWDNQDLMHNSDLSIPIITFSPNPKSYNADILPGFYFYRKITITQRNHMIVNNFFESLRIVDNSLNVNDICKCFIPTSTMIWDEYVENLTKNIYKNYFYLKLDTGGPLIISNINFNSAPTPSYEFNDFMKNCCIANTI
jgi:hypothetical protein